jgi:V-type H+-transporting ATPase subunit C
MSLKPPLRYQFISAPADNTKEMTLQKLKAKVATGSNELAEVAPLPIPDFKVGTLDSLVQASDELSKVDSSVESIVKRLAENVKSLLESNEAAERARTQLLVNDRKYLQLLIAKALQDQWTHTLETFRGILLSTGRINRLKRWLK